MLLTFTWWDRRVRNRTLVLTCVLGALTIGSATAYAVSVSSRGPADTVEPDDDGVDRVEGDRVDGDRVDAASGAEFAEHLVATTRETLEPYASEPEAVLDGYVPNEIAGGPNVHYRHAGRRGDGKVLDPTAPEGLVYRRADGGELVLLGAVFVARPGEEAPLPGGDAFRWHTHAPDCGMHPAPGECEHRQRMMHVWISGAAAVHHPFADSFREAVHAS
jgi:hypothetical protein